METLISPNLQQHCNCPYYMKDDEPVFEIINHSRNVTVGQKMKSIALVVVREGTIEFSWENRDARQAVADEMFLLPVNVDFTVKFIEYSSLLYLYVPSEMEICWSVKQMLAGYSIKTNEEGSILKINNLIQMQIELFIETTKYQQLCAKCLNYQTNSILFTICANYPAELLADFFMPIRYTASQQLTNFQDIVLRNKNRLFSVTEFAAETYMSRTTFRRHFERIFGTNPQDWIKQERLKLIEHELKYDIKPLNEIAKLTGFNNTREFYFYCRKHFGKTATEIRKGVSTKYV